MMNDEKKQQFNIYLPPSLIRAIKHAAIEQGVSLSSLVEMALRQALEEGSAVPSDRRPPSSLPITPMPIIVTRDFDAALGFYQRLGFQLAAEDREHKWAKLRMGDMLPGIHEPSDSDIGGVFQGTKAIPPPITLSFYCRGIPEDVLLYLVERNIPLLGAPIVDKAYGRTFSVRDPDGREIEIVERDQLQE